MLTRTYTFVRRESLFALALLSLLALGFSRPAHAQSTLKVAILGAPEIVSWNDDVKAKLVGTGLFAAVDVYNVRSSIPSLATLKQYNSVLVYTDAYFQESVPLGDELADYIDGGGGVVLSVFADASISLYGRFKAADYYCLEPASQAQNVRLTLGAHDANSPLLAGVSSFDGGSSSYRGTGTTNAGATVVAAWSNGAPLVVTRNIGGVHRVDLNFFPPSNAVRSDLWKASTDGAKLMGNALVYVARPFSFSIGTLDGAADAHALVTGFVTLRNPAPAGGEILPLASDNAVATVPASVFVPEGASYATFPVQINSITSVNKANVPVSVTFGTNDGVEFSESSFTAYPAGIARADSFVQDGAGADTNFGTAPSLLVSADGVGGSGNNRDTYLRFKFDGFHSVTKARLRVYASVSDGTSAPVGVYGVATNGWDQSTLTFSNRPALTSLLKTFTASGTSVVKYDIDVTPYVQAALTAGKSTVSLALHLPNVATGTVSLVSKETQDLKPQLILQGN